MDTVIQIWQVGCAATFLYMIIRILFNRVLITNKLQELLSTVQGIGQTMASFVAALIVAAFVIFFTVFWPFYLFKIITKKGNNDNRNNKGN